MDQDVYISEDPPANTADLCVILVDDDNPGAGLRAPLTVFLDFGQFGDQPEASKFFFAGATPASKLLLLCCNIYSTALSVGHNYAVFLNVFLVVRLFF